ncbi:hypothetical protein [Actinoplanes teichomyceticus]|uniref:Uncharacterized protein n=1 Tax=Actinoplanes teichomyceticus TaxID=1867 RepID=A0A561WRQ8_ACTTI|nr:hypothetical protein [Actinoplanes teichomyceticus]TWG26560.1 hypothetical protein FHX34_1011548 [Actinoplanes teichomyceticus]GIF16956.1 hypothetical protein Ate01nite_69880 [Actinoplanes teichomyceticus]
MTILLLALAGIAILALVTVLTGRRAQRRHPAGPVSTGTAASLDSALSYIPVDDSPSGSAESHHHGHSHGHYHGHHDSGHHDSGHHGGHHGSGHHDSGSSWSDSGSSSSWGDSGGSFGGGDSGSGSY